MALPFGKVACVVQSAKTYYKQYITTLELRGDPGFKSNIWQMEWIWLQIRSTPIQIDHWGVETTITVKAEYIFKIGALGVRGAAFIIGDGNFFPKFNITDYIDSFALYITVLTTISIQETAIVNKAYSRVDPTNPRVGAIGQSVNFNNTAKQVLTREVIIKGKELLLFSL